MENKIILIAGGSASGKSLMTNVLSKKLNNQCVIMKIDSFCISNSHLTLEERSKVNYDLPTSYTSEEMLPYLKDLKSGKEVDIPVYDFANHIRSKKTEHLKPNKYILVEGLFALYYDELLKMGDYKIFMKANEKMRFSRRLKRDVKERGRTPESVKVQFTTQVEPMHEKYVENTQKNADIIVENNSTDGLDTDVIEKIISKIKF